MDANEMCGVVGFDSREFFFNATAFWMPVIKRSVKRFPSVTHLINSVAVVSKFLEAIMIGLLDSCYSHWTGGRCKSSVLLSLMAVATSDLGLSMNKYWDELDHAADAPIGELGSFRTIVFDFLSEERSFVNNMFTDFRGTYQGMKAISIPDGYEHWMTPAWVCTEVLRSTVDRVQSHLFRLHAALANSQQDAPQPLPAALAARYERSLRCYGICGYVHGSVAEAVLLDPTRAPRPDHEVRAAEIGTYLGVTALRLLAGVPRLQLMMVDPFEEAAPLDDGQTYRSAAVAYEMVHAALAPYRNRTQLVKQQSHVAASWVQDGLLDAVIVDGDHTYEGCMTDVKSWAPKLRRDETPGALIFHDYALNFPGVIRCVHEALLEVAESDAPLRIGPGFTAWIFARA